MKRIVMLLVVCMGGLVSGCGGMPEPQINAVEPRTDATLVRVSLVATNYDPSWDTENLRLRAHQEWLNDDGVPVDKEEIFEQPYGTMQAANRGTIKLKDADGNSDDYVRLNFELISGENPNTENVSAGTTIEWGVPSSFYQQDIVMVCVVSRAARNSYAIDALYALHPQTGETVQILPSYYAN